MRCRWIPGLACLAAGLLLWGGDAGVRAQGLTSCSISTVGVAFGSYNVFTATPVDAVGSVSFQCSAPVAVVVQLGTGSASSFSPRTLRRAGEPLNYNLYRDAAHTSIWGNGTGGTSTWSGTASVISPTVVQIYGRLFAQQDVTSGAYTDTVVATIVF